MEPFIPGECGGPAWHDVKEAVALLLDNDPGLEYRYWVAAKLRPSSGFEDYFFGLDPEFCDRVDGNWMELFQTLNRQFLMHNPVSVTNL